MAIMPQLMDVTHDLQASPAVVNHDSRRLWEPVARTQSASVCAPEENSQKFLNAKVEVRALIVEGFEHVALIKDGRCSFLFAGGDDYQTFGRRFHVKHNAQWRLMEEILAGTNCGTNIRVVRARIRGTVIRIPATGTIRRKRWASSLSSNLSPTLPVCQCAVLIKTRGLRTHRMGSDCLRSGARKMGTLHVRKSAVIE